MADDIKAEINLSTDKFIEFLEGKEPQLVDMIGRQRIAAIFGEYVTIQWLKEYIKNAFPPNAIAEAREK